MSGMIIYLGLDDKKGLTVELNFHERVKRRELSFPLTDQGQKDFGRMLKVLCRVA